MMNPWPNSSPIFPDTRCPEHCAEGWSSPGRARRVSLPDFRPALLVLGLGKRAAACLTAGHPVCALETNAGHSFEAQSDRQDALSTELSKEGPALP